jgi:uncharacterized iron-regulated protein
MRARIIAAALLVSCAAACGGHAGSPGDRWLTKLDKDHPLVGRIWDVKNEKFIDRALLSRELVQADFVLLGEKHDNPDHHRLQAACLRQMVDAHRTPVLALEMVDADEQPIVDGLLKGGGAQAFPASWERRGWPPWNEYSPIFQVAFDAGLRLVAANLPIDQARAIAKTGKVEPDVAERLGIDAPLPPEAQTALEDELRASHCGHLKDDRVAPMALAQRARDGEMARRMVEEANGKGAVLIAGAGHARTDRGVPVVIHARRPEAKIVSVGFTEVTREAAEPAAYASHYAAKELPFDYVWFTPRYTDEDPCVKFGTRP